MTGCSVRWSKLRNLGNTAWSADTTKKQFARADFVVDLGPGVGDRAATSSRKGTLKFIAATAASLTGQYLSGAARIAVPEKRRSRTEKPFRFWERPPIISKM